jgi:hypothetical protein
MNRARLPAVVRLPARCAAFLKICEQSWRDSRDFFISYAEISRAKSSIIAGNGFEAGKTGNSLLKVDRRHIA